MKKNILQNVVKDSLLTIALLVISSTSAMGTREARVGSCGIFDEADMADLVNQKVDKRYADDMLERILSESWSPALRCPYISCWSAWNSRDRIDVLNRLIKQKVLYLPADQVKDAAQSDYAPRLGIGS